MILSYAKKGAFIASIAVISSCNLYKPTALNTPILQEKGDLNASVALVNSLDLMVNYAVTDHIAVQASVATAYELELTSEVNGVSESATFPNYKYDIGLAYYNEKTNGDNFLIGGGYSAGEMGALIDNTDDDFIGLLITEGAYGASFNSGFIQSNYFFEVGTNWYIGILGRVNYLTFDEFDYSFIFSDSSNFSSNFAPRENSAIIGQLGAEVKFTGDRVGAFAQLHTAFDSNDERYFSTRRMSLHIGVAFKLNEILGF